MAGKVLWATMAAIGLMAVSGIGFAAFVATGSATVSGQAGTLTFDYTNVVVTSSAMQGGYAGDMNGCTAAGITYGVTGSGGATLSISAGDMSVGDWCAVTFEIANTGNIPGKYVVSPSSTPPSNGCWQWVPAGASSGTLAAGGVSETPTTIALEVNDDNGGAGNSCEGSPASIVASITLTGITVGEAGEPPGL